jgi:anaerobic magnesium-protoporphyrin IX monomethyl ester cyclase
MKKILFTHSYFYKLDAKQWRFKQPYPPLATLLAAAVVREHGYDVALFDTNLRSSPLEIEQSLRVAKPDYVILYDDGFNYLTKMCLTVMREAAFTMIQRARQYGCTVIVSSSDASDHFEKYLEAGADYVLVGEAEQTLVELLDALHKKEKTGAIAGLAFRADKGTIKTARRTVMTNLDALPMPAWDLVDIRSVWLKHHGYFSLNIATTRGCPYKCNWCAKPIYGNRYNSRSPEKVVTEIEWLLKNFQPDHFWMCDDIFGLKPGWIQHFAYGVQEKGLRFRYKIQSRADLLLHENIIDALAQSGAESVWIGAESGSQKILDAMDKGITVDEIKAATQLLKQREIKVGYFLQLGYLGEDKDDIDKTINMVLSNMPDEIGISVSYPLPGTRFYELVKDQLKEKQNWTDSDDLAMMFESTFRSAFYKTLHRYIHACYRKQKALLICRKLFANPRRVTWRDLRTAVAAVFYTVYEFVLRYAFLKPGDDSIGTRMHRFKFSFSDKTAL